MVDRFQAIRGMNDVLPGECSSWQYLEQAFSQVLKSYGYHEIRFPIVEQTALFKRSIGEVTDIVEKEMYTFSDLNGDQLTLRPEGTAGCVRACLEHGLLHNQQQKLWYFGPMFRHEKPQKGRYRQFHQFGVEVFGVQGVASELELLMISHKLWSQLGLSEAVSLEINTIGSFAERQAYRQILIDYLGRHLNALDEDSKRRLHRNPLRILDSKQVEMQPIIKNAPRLIDHLTTESRQRFEQLCDGLTNLGVKFTINPFLVRGLDYYEHTVFEWVTDQLGSQATLCAGGRFDKLVEHLGGSATSAIGFAMGAERLLLLMKSVNAHNTKSVAPVVYVLAFGDKAVIHALQLAESIRESLWISVEVNTAGGGFKSQFKKADKSGARFALIIGEDELRDNTVTVKELRDTGHQKTMLEQELTLYLKSYMN